MAVPYLMYFHHSLELCDWGVMSFIWTDSANWMNTLPPQRMAPPPMNPYSATWHATFVNPYVLQESPREWKMPRNFTTWLENVMWFYHVIGVSDVNWPRDCPKSLRDCRVTTWFRRITTWFTTWFSHLPRDLVKSPRDLHFLSRDLPNHHVIDFGM